MARGCVRSRSWEATFMSVNTFPDHFWDISILVWKELKSSRISDATSSCFESEHFLFVICSKTTDEFKLPLKYGRSGLVVAKNQTIVFHFEGVDTVQLTSLCWFCLLYRNFEYATWKCYRLWTKLLLKMIVSKYALSKNILKPENPAIISLEACEANHALNDFRKF